MSSSLIFTVNGTFTIAPDQQVFVDTVINKPLVMLLSRKSVCGKKQWRTLCRTRFTGNCLPMPDCPLPMFSVFSVCTKSLCQPPI